MVSVNGRTTETAYVGEIRSITGTTAPTGWLLCTGGTVAIATYPLLYAVLGTTYGGDGVTTFGLPDMRGRTILGANGTYPLGSSGGSANATLTTNELPAHNHAFMASTVFATFGTPDPTYSLATEPTGATALYKDVAPDTALLDATIADTGSGNSFSIVQPYVAINYIIAYSGYS